MATSQDLLVLALLVALDENTDIENILNKDDVIDEMFAIYAAQIQRQPAVRIIGYVEDVVSNYSDAAFKETFRIRSDTYIWLLDALSGLPELLPRNIAKGGKQQVPLAKMVLLTLEILRNQISFRSVSEKYNLASATVHRCFTRICKAIKNNLTPGIICWPKEEEMDELSAAFEEHKGFPNVIGAIDGNHIPIRAPRLCPENYINRKGWHSINLQAVCGKDLR